MDQSGKIKGRGSSINPNNRFSRFKQATEHWEGIDEKEELNDKTRFIEVVPKTIVNKVKSPDLPMEYSLNPYQGCEHGCIYCYARPTHEYWGYSAGLDFENTILVKTNAVELLEKEFQKEDWKVSPIVLSGNTDCYQPCERKYKLTRSILELCLKYKHPVGIITKNTLLLRDLDILKELADLNLVQVIISMTSLDENLRRILEPRTSSVKNKLEAIKTLNQYGIPVYVLFAPIIPSVNDHEMFNVLKAVSDAGAIGASYQIVRLNGPNAELFYTWTEQHFPDRKNKIIHQLESMHGGQLGDSRFGTRMRGEGEYALSIQRQFGIAKRKFFQGKERPQYNTSSFLRNTKGQLPLF